MTLRVARPGFRPDERGTAAVEFGLLLPVLLLILVGTIDFGGALYTKFRINAALSAGANYAMTRASSVTAAGASGLATNVASILTSSNTAATTSGVVVVNNGITATLASSGTTTSGTASNADSCYCPTLSSGALAWGSASGCSGTCSGGSNPPGKYVAITASQTYTPFFSNWGIVQNGAISGSVVVRAQ